MRTTAAPATDTTPVVQPCGCGGAGVRIGATNDTFEQEADRVADAIVSGQSVSMTAAGAGDGLVQRQVAGEEEEEEIQAKPAAGGLKRSVGATAAAAGAVQSGGRAMSAGERAFFEPRFGRDLGHVRLHTDAGVARSIGARAYTHRNHIAFAPGEFHPGTTYGRHLIAHELTHTIQQAGHGTGSVIRRQPTSLSAIPEAERRAIHVTTIEATMPDETRDEIFTLMSSGRPGTTFSVGATNSFGTGINAAFQDRLASAAAWYAGQTNTLPIGASLEVALDLSGYGGQRRRFRFTRFNHTTGSGRSATTQQIMLIEDAGAPVAIAQSTGTVPSTLTVGSNSFPLQGTWTNAKFSVLRQAISLLPAATQTSANGLTFRRRSGAAPGTEAGHFDPEHDRVDLYDTVFDATNTLTGGQPGSVRMILHEIGHALDLRPLETAWRAFNTAGQTPRARRTFEAVRSPSGSRYELDSGNTWQREIHAADRSPAFRRAVRRDGVRDDTSGRTTPEGTTATLSGGVTTYSDTDYEEMFGEAFALYVSDPARLEQLRPHTFAFMQTTFPRTP